MYMKYQETQFWGIIISWKSLVFPLIYFHVNEQWTAKPIRHTRQPISSLIQTRSRNNSTKRCFQENCFLSFVSNHSCNILSNLSLKQTELVYSNRCCLIMFVTIFSFCLLVSGSLSGWINWHGLESDDSSISSIPSFCIDNAYEGSVKIWTPCYFGNDWTNTQFSDCLWFCV